MSRDPEIGYRLVPNAHPSSQTEMSADNDAREHHDEVDMPERASGYLGRVIIGYFACEINVYRPSMLEISPSLPLLDPETPCVLATIKVPRYVSFYRGPLHHEGVFHL